MKFYYKIVYSIIFVVTSCKGIIPLYKKDILEGEKICVLLKIENNIDRMFLYKLNENIHISDYPNCNYILFLIIYDKFLNITNISGLNQGKIIDMNIYYHLYKNNFSYKKEIDEILNNSSLRTNKPYIERYNYYMSSGDTVDDITYLNYDNKGLKDYYNNSVKRFDLFLEKISSSNIQEQISFMQNNLLLPASSIDKQSNEEALLDPIAERLLQNTIVDILIYKEKQKKHKNEENKALSNNAQQINFDKKYEKKI